MTLVCDHSARNRNDPVPTLVLFCAQMGDVMDNAPFVWRYACDTCGAYYLIDGNCAAVFRNRYRVTG